MSSTLRYFEPTQIRAWRPEGAVHMRLEVVGERTVLSARIRRTYPLSEPNRYLSIQDGAGKEVGILRDAEGLDPQTRAEFDAHLDRRYFTPRILQIESLRQEAGMWRFVVETQRGRSEFFVRNWRDNAHEISPNRWHILSVDGGRYEIPNLEALDAQSRRLMDLLL
jgi:hypothetical protein